MKLKSTRVLSQSGWLLVVVVVVVVVEVAVVKDTSTESVDGANSGEPSAETAGDELILLMAADNTAVASDDTNDATEPWLIAVVPGEKSDVCMPGTDCKLEVLSTGAVEAAVVCCWVWVTGELLTLDPAAAVIPDDCETVGPWGELAEDKDDGKADDSFCEPEVASGGIVLVE